MAKTTVDLVQLLKEFSTEDGQASIQIWADGSYLLVDSGNGDILNSEHLISMHPMSDIHGLLMHSPEKIKDVGDATQEADTAAKSTGVKFV